MLNLIIKSVTMELIEEYKTNNNQILLSNELEFAPEQIICDKQYLVCYGKTFSAPILGSQDILCLCMENVKYQKILMLLFVFFNHHNHSNFLAVSI